MPYEIVLAPEAEEQLSKLDPLVQSGLLDRLEELAESPTTLSRPSFFPYLPGYQLYLCAFEALGHRQAFVVFFRYSSDEASIWVYFFTHTDYGNLR